MTALFSKPKMPALPPPPPPAPTFDQAAQADDMARMFARRKGRMALYTGGGGNGLGGTGGPASVATKTLLGGP